MQLVMYEYLEINFIGVILLTTLLLFAKKRHGEGQINFVHMLLLNALILLADNGIYLLRGHASPGLIVLNHFVCLAYFVPQLWFCLEWVRYVLKRLHPQLRSKKLLHWLLLLPALANTVLVVSSPLNGWIYTLSDQNVYHRGPYLWVPFLGALLYWLISTALILMDLRRPARKLEPEEYWRLIIFPLPILAGNLLQLRFYGMSIAWVCSVISMLVMFLDMQYEQLSRDTLTGLYNRRQMETQLRWEIARLRASGDLLFVALFDVDHFKQINDQYGHLSGDQALILVAQILSGVCRRDDLVSRFGGDEFLLIGHVEQMSDTESLLQRIEASLTGAVQEKQLPYKLTLSFGCVYFRSTESVSVDTVLNAADQKMYEVKRQKRCAPQEA